MSYAPAAGRSELLLRVSARSTLLWLIPFGVAAVYLVLFLTQLSHHLWVLEWNSDYSSGFTIPTTLVQTGTGGHTVLGTSGAWVPLWFGLLTAKLPFHRLLWELAPTGLFWLTAAAVGWSVAQVASRRAALLATLLILVASPRALYFFMAPVAHNVVYPGTALLGAYLLWLARGQSRPALTTWVVSAVVGIVLGTLIASDELLIVTGVVPFAITGALCALKWDRHGRTVAGSAVASVVIAVPVAKLTSAIMTSAGYVIIAPSTQLAPLSSLPVHAELMWEGLLGLMNGYLRRASSDTLVSALGRLCEIAMVTGLVTLLVMGVLATARLIAASVRRKRLSGVQLLRALLVSFWAGSAGATSVAWALSIRIEYVHESYYATLIFSVAAVIALLADSRTPARWLVAAGASVFFAASAVGLADHFFESYVLPIARSYQTTPFVPRTASYERQILGFAKAQGVKVGYAGYLDAPSLAWSSHEQLLVRPVQLCDGPQGVSVCPFFVERVPSWYTPAKQKTFLLVDADERFLTERPEDLGEPTAAATFGPIQMYVYPYDIAARMAPPAT